jgi:hypothetical protein
MKKQKESIISTVKSIVKFILFLIIICIACTTNNITTIIEHGKLGITISTGDQDSDSTLILSFSLDRLVDSLPVITVNGNHPDTPYFDPLLFSFHNIKFDTSFTFQIAYKNDTLCDTAFIPGIIDSLFINGVYISPDKDYGLLWLPDSSDTLHFYWKDSIKSNYYYVYIHSDLTNSQIEKYTSDSTLTLNIDFEKKNNEGYTAINIAKWDDFNLYRQSNAAITSKKLFIYYNLQGPQYNSYKRLLR